MSLVQKPFGPFCDFDIFVLEGKRNPTRFASHMLLKLQMLVQVDGALVFGGVDDIYKQQEQIDEEYDGEKEEDAMALRPSHQHMQHRFFGTVKITSPDVLSERGRTLLKDAGADLTVFEEGGEIFVIIRGIFHRYESYSFSQDNGTWITSINGSKDDPRYIIYRVTSHHRATYERCRVTRERLWWLEFVRYCCDKKKGKRSADKRTIAWLIKCYMEMFPTHESGVHPPSAGPPKHTKRSEVRLALGRNAAFIQSKLKRAKPRPMNMGEWTKLQADYEESPTAQMPLYEAVSDSEDDLESVSDDEYKDDHDIDDEMATGPEDPHRSREPSERHTVGISREGTPVEAVIEELTNAMDAFKLPEEAADNPSTKHTPTLSPTFQYTCPFDSSIPGGRTNRQTQCVYKLDLLHLTEQQIRSLPNELRNHVNIKYNTPATSVIFAALLDSHILQHLRNRDGMLRLHGVYEVEIPIHPSFVDLVVHCPSIYKRFDPKFNVIRYRWVVDPVGDNDGEASSR